MNIRISYLYRDASNYKRWADVVFANPSDLAAAAVWNLLAGACRRWELFRGQIHFMPERVGLKTCYFTDIGYEESDDDLELHEVHEVVETERSPTDSRSIEAFIEEVGFASPAGDLGAHTVSLVTLTEG